MRKILLIIAGVLISVPGFSQTPDSDGDGINDAEDLCPFVKGTRQGKGCLEKTAAIPLFITQTAMDNILTAVCTNKLNEKVKGRSENNKTVLTTFPLNGDNGLLPVYYKQSGPLNVTVMIGLSEKISDTNKVLASVNELFANSNACDGVYRRVRLTYSQSGKNYTDVYASEAGGVFFYLEKVKSGTKSLIRLRINQIIYEGQPGKNNIQPAPAMPQTDCATLEKIMDASLKGYGGVKGNFVKEEIPAKYYTTTLPDLGLQEKYVVDSKNIDFVNGQMIRKDIVYYSASQEYSSSPDALKMFDKLKTMISKCLSGAITNTDDKNQKIYELIIDYKGNKIRVALIYLNFFSSSVSVSIKLAD